MRWYEWSLKVLDVKLATRRQAYEEAVAMADALAQAPGAPQSDLIQADLAACEALLGAGRLREAELRLEQCEDRLDPRRAPANWGEFLRIRGLVREQLSRPQTAHHDFAQSANIFQLLGERYQAALSHLALGRLSAASGSPEPARRYLDQAAEAFTLLGAQRDLAELNIVREHVDTAAAKPPAVSAPDADEAIVRRLVDAAIFKDLLAREIGTALLEITEDSSVVVFTESAGGGVRVVAAAGCSSNEAMSLAHAARQGHSKHGSRMVLVEPLGSDEEGARRCAVAHCAALPDTAAARVRMFAAIARQGFDLCKARERPNQAIDQHERPLAPLLPGFICAGPAMGRLADQIQRLQGHTLTVLITGESGTGKDLVARAIHVGSPRHAAMFLPYNCTTTSRELADSQLFGHRRGSFTGAINDQQGLIRSAAGGTLFLDEIGDLPLDVQPKLLRFLEQGEIMPVGDTRPQAVDVRVLAATNADLEQRVSEGKFREDLYYRLSVIRIHVPPLRERREEVPHLSTFFLRDACDRLGKPDVHLSSATLDLFARYWWPGNVRQLRNEIQRAVAMSSPGGTIEPEHLSADLTAPGRGPTTSLEVPAPTADFGPGNLAAAVEIVERHVITTTLDRTRGNISESARVLGLTRRGLYLKMRRLGLEGAMADTQ